MQFRLSYLAIFMIVSLSQVKAQYINAEIGGANLIFPTISYEHHIPSNPDKPYSNGLRLKWGIGHFSPLGNSTNVLVFKTGLSGIWGKRNNWTAGLEVSFSNFFASEDASGNDAVTLYPNFGYRVGKGWFQGVVGAGPAILFVDRRAYRAPDVIPMVNAGLAFRLWDNNNQQ